MLVYETKTDPKNDANDTLNIQLYYGNKDGNLHSYKNEVVIGPDITATRDSEGFFPTKILVDGKSAGGGGGSEPAQYIKGASVTGHQLTLTKKDDSVVTFTDTVYDDSAITSRVATNEATIDNFKTGVESVNSAVNATNYVSGGSIETSINSKQDKLTAGTGITIDSSNVISANISAGYITLEGWVADGDWHAGGTITDAQATTLLASELSYIWMNGMHRLDFRYRDTPNNLATYSANDGVKTHVIEITLSDKTWRYAHIPLQPKFPDPPTTAGTYTLQVTVDGSGSATYSWA